MLLINIFQLYTKITNCLTAPRQIGSYIFNSYEYSDIHQKLVSEITSISENMNALVSRDFATSITYFKMALMSFNILSNINQLKKNFKNAKKLAMLAVDTVHDLDEKIIATKIIIISSIFIFNNNIENLIPVIYVSLERLLNFKKIREVIKKERLECLTFKKEKRNEFVLNLRDLVRQCCKIINHTVINPSSSEFELQRSEDEKKINIMFKQSEENFINFKCMDISKYTRFLFWTHSLSKII